MSGPVKETDTPAVPEPAAPATAPGIELSASRDAVVGGVTVRRALPKRGRRTIGAWCFVDHFGPVAAEDAGDGMQVGPHPHIGLHTVTWLLDGEALHRDSLGSEQLIRPGQLNLMTAGHGVTHAEETPSTYGGGMHGVQLWVAQPERTRHGAPAFEHHATLPQADLDHAVATVLLGSLAGATSTARQDTPLLGVDLVLRPGATTVPLDREYEHGFVVLDGAVLVEGEVVRPGALAYVGIGREELALRATDAARVLLFGGVPFGEQVLMWWNFVGRERDEISAARAEWEEAGERFGTVASALPRIPSPPVPWAPAGSA